MVLINGYEVDEDTKPLSEGPFGIVRLARHISTGETVIIKEIDMLVGTRSEKLDIFRENVRREVLFGKTLQHPCIVECLRSTIIEDKAYLVLEKMEGGDLDTYIANKKLLSENKARKIFRQLVEGLEYLHSHLIVHRDIKPKNLLLDKKQRKLKIADFGTSRFIPEDEMMTTYCGTLGFMSPEVKEKKKYLGPPADIWSAGATLYYCLTGKRLVTSSQIAKCDALSEDASDLISRMTILDANNRIAINGIKKHRWYKKTGAIVAEVKGFDIDILRETIDATGIDRDLLITKLLKRRKTACTAHYELLKRKKYN